LQGDFRNAKQAKGEKVRRVCDKDGTVLIDYKLPCKEKNEREPLHIAIKEALSIRNEPCRLLDQVLGAGRSQSSGNAKDWSLASNRFRNTK